MKRMLRMCGLAGVLCASLWVAPQGVWACAVCYGSADSPMQQGMNMGIAVMLGVTALVLTGFASFMIYLARRARLYREKSLDLAFVDGKERVQ